VTGTIAVVDACSGNLRSVERALAQVGGSPIVTRDPDVIRRADRVVVPGQGAFAEFARGLAERGLGEALREALASGRPFLGICLGLQVLFEDSEEHAPGSTTPVPGLGILSGHVVRFAASATRKVPHIGWNQVRRGPSAVVDPMLAGIAEGSYFYFVHSYHAIPERIGLHALTCTYGGERFCAAVRKDNLFAVQFHPEKSQALGLRLLGNFVSCG
jgi:imidazole glycerol-phosphate synthase subunit HisH